MSGGRSRVLSSSWPQSHYDLIEHYYAQYDEKISTGQYRPFLYPWGAFGALIVIIYLCIPHQTRPWLKRCRYLAFAWITAFATYTILCTRARGMAASLGVGLVSAWSIAWVSAILVCNDAQTDFQRIERLEGAFKRSEKMWPWNLEINRDSYDTVKPAAKDEKNGHGGTSDHDMVKGCSGLRHRHGEFAWQPYPLTPFVERLDWVCDIFCNFRGAGWNWRTSALPPPPKWVQEQLHHNARDAVPKSSSRIHPGQVRMYSTRQELLNANLKTFITGYLALDALKTCMMHDRYFWGLMSSSAPIAYPIVSPILSASPALTHIYRQTLSMLAIKSALETIFSLAPLVFAGVIGPRILGARAEPWIYPETWASYSVVLDSGLAGWWSSWWHQTFRFAFEQPSRRLVEHWGWNRSSIKAKALQLIVAFGMSGIVHASGSITCAGPTKPMHGPFYFFILQAFGILGEASISRVLKAKRIGQNVPTRWKKVLTFIYVHIWFYYTAHLLCDDFASGGVWLFEPVPISIFRGVGLGVDRRDSWWCWSGKTLIWHKGETWWTTGLAL